MFEAGDRFEKELMGPPSSFSSLSPTSTSSMIKLLLILELLSLLLLLISLIFNSVSILTSFSSAWFRSPCSGVAGESWDKEVEVEGDFCYFFFLLALEAVV